METTPSTGQYYSLEDFSLIEKYDAHMHLNTYDQTFVQQSKEDNFKLITINIDVAADFPSIDEQQDFAVQQCREMPERVKFISTFSLKDFHQKDWLQQTMDRLKDSFSKGAIAVKVWKNIGMELRDPDGSFVMIDDARFDPILEFLARNKVPLIGHLGEPKNCWLPLNEMTVQGDRDYFSSHPEYHMYLHPEYPSYEQQIEARDRMLEKHPELQFIGAHFGSLEWNVDEISKRLDKLPNMAVDTAERISHLQLQAVKDWQKVRDFIMKYQDRIIYGTDIIVNGSMANAEMKKHAHDIRFRHWQFFTSDEMMRVPKVDGEFQALHLPTVVVDKIYRLNAERWYRLKELP